MAGPEPVDNVKLLVAVLWAEEQARNQAQQRLTEHWGPLDYIGTDHVFDATDYYQPEMGSPLMRRLITAERLIPPESIREGKLFTNQIEQDLAGPSGRSVNLDLGYLDHNKVVLASMKYAGQKIHLGDGVYADLIARYERGAYRPFNWTFPDFRDGRYDDELQWIRNQYLQQRRSQRR
jgi:hypothetical protein